MTSDSSGEEGAPLDRVVLLDDSEHTFDYVIDMLKATFSVSEEKAIECAIEVDSTGRSVVANCSKEEAERGRDLICRYGPDPRLARSASSMIALVEPAI